MKTIHALTALACCALTAGCGGGGGDAGASSPVAGLYEGAGGSDRASEFLILDSGRYYLVYGMNSTSAAPAGGVIVGDGSANGSTFTSGNAHDFNLQANTLLTGTLTSTVAPKVSASTALVRSDGSGATFAGTFNATSDANPSLSTLAGTYAGQLAGLGGSQVSALTVDGASGLIGGVIIGGTPGSCTYSGLASKHGSGNVFDIGLNLGAGCPYVGTLRGHAFLSGKVLFGVTVSGDFATVVLFSGVKP